MLRRRRFLTERRSVAALEFALILPVMLVLVAGVYDITEALIVYNTVNNIANGVVATGSILAEQSDGSTALSYDEVQTAESTIWADFPELRRGQKNGTKSVTLSSVTFEPPGNCPSGSECSEYTAYVVWSEDYTGPGITGGPSFASNLRTCSPPGGPAGGEFQVAAGTQLTQSNFTTTLPTLDVSTNADYPGGDETGPSPILVADVTFSYTPLFNFYIKSSLTFIATAMWPVRSVKNVQTIVSGTAPNQTYILPLAQQFTTIIGKASNGTLTLYGTNNQPETDAPTVSTGGGGGTSTNFCINSYLTSPYPVPYSAPPTT